MTSVLVLLMGVPGSGKSTVASKLIQQNIHNNISLVSYDDLYDEMNDVTNQESSNTFDRAVWHNSRIESLGRASALLQKKNQTEHKKNINMQSVSAASTPDNSFESLDDCNIVILDDTFHYRSMRKEAARVAKVNQSGLVIIWVYSSLSTCLERNAARSFLRRVPDASLIATYESLELPWMEQKLKQADSEENDRDDDENDNIHTTTTTTTTAMTSVAAEDAGLRVRRSKNEHGAEVVVLLNDSIEENQDIEPLESRLPPLTDIPTATMSDLTPVWKAIQAAKNHPQKLTSIEQNDEEILKSRAITSKSVIHLADLVLRKVIADCVRAVQLSMKQSENVNEMKNSGSGDVVSGDRTTIPNNGLDLKTKSTKRPVTFIPVSQLARILNEERKLLLCELKQGTLPLIIDDEEANTKTDIESDQSQSDTIPSNTAADNIPNKIKHVVDESMRTKLEMFLRDRFLKRSMTAVKKLHLVQDTQNEDSILRAFQQLLEKKIT